MHEYVEYARLFRNMNARICRNMREFPEYVEICGNMEEYVGICKKAGICWNISKYEGICRQAQNAGIL